MDNCEFKGITVGDGEGVFVGVGVRPGEITGFEIVRGGMGVISEGLIEDDFLRRCVARGVRLGIGEGEGKRTDRQAI